MKKLLATVLTLAIALSLSAPVFAAGTSHETHAHFTSFARSACTEHNISAYYNGNNYHSGSKHYAQYTQYCTSCGKTLGSYWVSYFCRGGSEHILPE